MGQTTSKFETAGWGYFRGVQAYGGRKVRLPLSLALLCVTAVGCAHSIIPGTQARDTRENREIVAVLKELREALVARDAPRLMTLVSRSYFEDCGTADPQDDYGYLELNEKLAAEALSTAQDVAISFQVYDIHVVGLRAWADIRFSSRARLELPGGRLWDTYRDFDRIEFAREDQNWRVVRGL